MGLWQMKNRRNRIMLAFSPEYSGLLALVLYHVTCYYVFFEFLPPPTPTQVKSVCSGVRWQTEDKPDSGCPGNKKISENLQRRTLRISPRCKFYDKYISKPLSTSLKSKPTKFYENDFQRFRIKNLMHQ